MRLVYPIYSQGLVSYPGKIIYSPRPLYEGALSNIRITNVDGVNYLVSLYRYIKSSNIKTLLYTFDLTAGDVINDDTTYGLVTGDYLFLESNVPNTAYVIEGIESLSSTM